MGFLTSALNQGKRVQRKRRNRSFSNTGDKARYKKKLRAKPTMPIRYITKYEKKKRRRPKRSNVYRGLEKSKVKQATSYKSYYGKRARA